MVSSGNHQRVDGADFHKTRAVFLSNGTLLLILALYKARIIWAENNGFKGLRLVKVLILDQAIYYAAYALNGLCLILQTDVHRP